MNESNQKVLSRAIHVISSLPKIDGVVREISSKEHEGPYSLLLKAQHIYILDTKAILVPAVLLFLYASLLYYCTRHGGCGVGCWWMDGILLLLLYSYIITMPVVHGRYAATATAAAAADRCSISFISSLAVVAVVCLLLV